MLDFTVMPSCEDTSVNHTLPTEDGGYLEARYVRRVPERWICYLSSHSGCNKACRFCHLTATGQLMMRPASLDDYLRQARRVFSTFQDKVQAGAPRGSLVHFNFMARGEPLENPTLLHDSATLFGELGAMAAGEKLQHRHKVSTIIPSRFTGDLVSVLDDPCSQLYYSLYGINEAFRRRWMPRAMPAGDGLDIVADYQRRTGRVVTLHWAFIQGENDGEHDVDETLDAVASRGIRAKFNLVRYNPHGPKHGQETPELRLLDLFRRVAGKMTAPGSRIIQRVGYDVNASCGMFVGGR